MPRFRIMTLQSRKLYGHKAYDCIVSIEGGVVTLGHDMVHIYGPESYDIVGVIVGVIGDWC